MEPRPAPGPRTALITGASRRIGRAIAWALAEQGVGIVAHYLHSDREARRLVDELRADGREGWLLRGDLENEAEVESLIDRAIAEADRPIDALVNNAAIFPADTLSTASPASIARALTINAWAPLALSRSLARQKRPGRIVNLLDVSIEGFRFGNVSYQLSKVALAMLTRMLAVELAPGIAVNAVAPGLVLPPPERDQTWLEEQARKRVPLARAGSPEDVARAVVFLLSSDYLTGQVIFVDGGKHLLEPTHGPDLH